MNATNAAGIAEGWIDASSEEEVLEAWQHLIDTGLAPAGLVRPHRAGLD